MNAAGHHARGLRAFGMRTMLIASVLALVAPVVASADPMHRAPVPPGPVLPPPPGLPPGFASPVAGHPGGQHRRSTGLAEDRPPFLAAANPIRATIDRLHLLGVNKIDAYASIPLAGGGRSPVDTVYMRLRGVTADNLAITQEVNGRSLALRNISNHDQNLLVRAGHETTVVEVWVTVNQGKVCVTPETFHTLVTSYAGVFGGRLDEVLALIATTFEPYINGPLRRVGPCIPVKELLPLAAVIVDAGVPLPDDLPAEKVDLWVYAAQITGDPNLKTATAPNMTVVVN